MTVSSDLNRISYTGNGTTTVFPVNYYFLQNEHLQVILISATGTETPQTLTANYTVTGAGNEAGGTVTMLVAPPTGTTLVIQRDVPATQETDYLANDPFPAESHERALDKLTMLVQQNERESDRALKIPLAAVQTTSTEMPLPQANRLLAWDQGGTAIRNFDPGTEFINVVGQQNSFADTFTGDGATTVFTLSGEPGSVANLDVSINGVTQVPSEDYTLSGSTLTFTTAPPAVASQILARFTEVYAEGAVNAVDVIYDPAGAGAVTTNVQAKLRETVSVKDFGAVGDGVTDDTAAIQAALNSGATSVYIPGGLYKITTSIIVDGNTGITARHIFGDGGFSSQLAWYGASGGTMLVIGKDPVQMTRFEGIYFNARELAAKIAHIGVSTTTVAVVRNMTFEQCFFLDARAGSAIWLGDFTSSPSIQEADIANFNVVRCQFFNNNHSITWDSTLALDVNIDACFMSRSSSGIFIDEALYMERGGSASVINSYIGGLSASGAKFAVYVKDGWVNIKNCEFEYGVGGSAGTLHLDTPVVSTTVIETPSSLINCRVSSPGVTGTGNYVLVSSNNHPLTILGCSFQGKSGFTTYAVNNTGGSRVVSVNNKYVGYFWNAASQFNVSSFGDIYNDGSTSKFIPVNLGTQHSITSTDSPYTVEFDDDTIVSESGACTINLPVCGLPHTGGGQHRKLTIKRTSSAGTTSIVAASGNTIDGLTQIDLVQNQDATIVLESDGFSKWLIIAFYSPGNQGAASTGTGTVKMANANNANSAGWVEISPGKYVPYWTDTTP